MKNTEEENLELTSSEAVTLRLEFYKENAKKTTRMMYVAFAVAILSVVLVFFSVSNRVQNVYFATDESGSLLKLIPLSKPNQNHRVIADWLNRGLVDIFDMDYVGLEKHLNDVSTKWFTKNGASQFIKSLKRNGYYNAIIEKKLSLKLVTHQTPIIVSEGLDKSKRVHNWTLQVPATITFFAENGQDVGKLEFTVVVSRRSLLDDAIGLGISQIIMKDKGR